MSGASVVALRRDGVAPENATLSLNVKQAGLLRFMAEAPPARAYWLRDGRRCGAATNLQPPSGASHLYVYRLGDGATGTRGEAIDRTTISVADLEALAGCWADPLRTLNAYGLELAAGRPDKRLNQVSVRLTDAETETLQAEADARETHVSAIVREAVASYVLDRRGRSTLLASTAPRFGSILQAGDDAGAESVAQGDEPVGPIRLAKGWRITAKAGVPLLTGPFNDRCMLHCLAGRMSVTGPDGHPIRGARIYTYLATGQPYRTFTDETFLRSHGPYVVADAGGAFPPMHYPDGLALRCRLVDSLGVELMRWEVLPPDPEEGG
jgi:hypothetical protein